MSPGRGAVNLRSVEAVQQVTVLAAFAAGIVSFLSPCVLPIVPGYLSFISGVSMEDLRGAGGHEHALEEGAGRRVALASVFFVLGFSTVFVLLGATASAVGSALFENQSWLGRVGGVVVIIFGLHTIGLIRIPFLYREARFHATHQPAKIAGAYLIGLAFAFGWTPCIGPVLAAILVLAERQETLGQGVMLLVIYSLGLGIPFLMSGFLIRPALKAMNRAKAHMRKIEIASGCILLLVGVLLLTDNLTVIAGYLSFLNRLQL